jgi:hypothetical protein
MSTAPDRQNQYRKVTNSRAARSIRRGSQQHSRNQEHTTKTSVTVGRDDSISSRNISNSRVDSRRDSRNITDVKSRRETHNSSGATTVETPRTVLATAGTLIATEMPERVWTTTTHEYSRKFTKHSINRTVLVR